VEGETKVTNVVGEAIGTEVDSAVRLTGADCDDPVILRDAMDINALTAEDMLIGSEEGAIEPLFGAVDANAEAGKVLFAELVTFRCNVPFSVGSTNPPVTVSVIVVVVIGPSRVADTSINNVVVDRETMESSEIAVLAVTSRLMWMKVSKPRPSFIFSSLSRLRRSPS